jgi:phosphoribosyl-AMP cyclohydrolase
MDDNALKRTIESGESWYFIGSLKQLWKKG